MLNQQFFTHPSPPSLASQSTQRQMIVSNNTTFFCCNCRHCHPRKMPTQSMTYTFPYKTNIPPLTACNHRSKHTAVSTSWQTSSTEEHFKQTTMAFSNSQAYWLPKSCIHKLQCYTQLTCITENTQNQKVSWLVLTQCTYSSNPHNPNTRT